LYRISLAAAGAALLAGASALAQNGAAPATAPTSVWDGVFTEAQADSGSSVYLSECSPCHGGSPDLPRFEGKPLGELFTFMRTRMPDGAPGTLSATQYTEVLAYLLEQSGFPAGTTPLPSTSSAMAGITLTFTK
jgi:mono/diheme cytochrome c family protein